MITLFIADYMEPKIRAHFLEPVVNSIRPHTFRCSTTTWCRSAAFSNSSRLFDLNGAVKTDQIKQTNAIMVCQG
jgi:hypothetical protein